VDCVSFAPYKRHLPLPALANLLQSSPTEHLGPSELETRCLAARALTRPEKRPSHASGAPYSWEALKARGTGSDGGSDDGSDYVSHMWRRAARRRTVLRLPDCTAAGPAC
jgi:hypothetical protein